MGCRGIGDQPAPDQAMAPVGADVILIAERRGCEIDLLATVLERLGLGVLDRPSSVSRRMIGFPKGTRSGDRGGGHRGPSAAGSVRPWARRTRSTRLALTTG